MRAYALAVEEEAIQIAAIEGEQLDREGALFHCPTSGLACGGLRPADRVVDALVEVLLDATHRHEEPLTESRLQGWHAARFPAGRRAQCRL